MSVYASLNDINRKIVDDAMQQHDRHYRALVRWIKEMTKKRGRFYRRQGAAVLGEILGHGHTVCCCIWEKYEQEGKS